MSQIVLDAKEELKKLIFRVDYCLLEKLHKGKDVLLCIKPVYITMTVH